MPRQGQKWVLLLVLCLALPAGVVLAPAYQGPPPVEHLNVPLIAQSMDQWCWAASAEMIMRFVGKESPSQCEMASYRTKPTDCCKDDGSGGVYPFPGVCDHPGWPPFKHYKYTFQRTHLKALTFKELQEQISVKRKPIAFSWRRIGSKGTAMDSGHMQVAIGYRVDLDGDWVEVNDPSYGSHGFILYDRYVAVAGQFSHWDDFYDISRKP